MKSKQKGTNAERELLHSFWEAGWATIRVAGSGSMQYPSPDIISGKGKRKLVIECKACKNSSQYLTKKEIEELKEFSKIFGAEAWISVKFNNKGWFFIQLEDLEDSGKNYVIKYEKAKLLGLRVNELLKI